MRAISNHYGLPAVPTKEERASGKEQDEVSGWVNLTSPVLEWMWSSVNYHGVHHKFPYLSHAYLKYTFIATRESLPYVVSKGYLHNLWQHLHRHYYADETPKSEF